MIRNYQKVSSRKQWEYLSMQISNSAIKRKEYTMKIVDIKGTRSYIRFITDDNCYIKGNGELLNNGFVVSKQSLEIYKNDLLIDKDFSDKKIEEIMEAVYQFVQNRDFMIDFE